MVSALVIKVRREMNAMPLHRKAYLIFMGLLLSIAVYRGEWLGLILILVLVYQCQEPPPLRGCYDSRCVGCVDRVGCPNGGIK